jgi:hypothetical protein
MSSVSGASLNLGFAAFLGKGQINLFAEVLPSGGHLSPATTVLCIPPRCPRCGKPLQPSSFEMRCTVPVPTRGVIPPPGGVRAFLGA